MTIMKKMILFLLLCFPATVMAQNAGQILDRVDRNMSAKNRIFESTMTIHGKRISRTITSRTYSEGIINSFTEYLSPASEKGTKMLKLSEQLWIYSPSADRTIQISGHMLRQSVMGSDLSYEDMMDDRKLSEIYEAEIDTEEVLDGRPVWVLKLTAKVSDAAYNSQKIWIDKERYVPVKQEMYAKSGQLLKRTELKDIKNIQGRWYPMTVVYKDMLKEGMGTEFRMTSVKFDQEIPEYIFSKAALKK